MTATPMLDKIAAEECLDDSMQLVVALGELAIYHDTALRGRGLSAELCCTIRGWRISYNDGYSHPSILSPSSGGYFACAEDAIHALREKVDGWIVRAEGEDAAPCTEAARKAGCTCTIPAAHSASIDPPEPRIDRECPLHGRSDPDAERQRRMDERIAR
jgi:hypothetical protein